MKVSLPWASIRAQESCVDGKRWGQGHLEDSQTKQTYDGEFRDHVVHGKGVLQGKDYRYEGDFSAGVKEGRGKEISGAEEYEGEFANGEREGQGRLKMTTEEGVSVAYEGGFSAGKAHGPGVLSLGSARLDGEFENGEFTRGRIEVGEEKFEIDVAKASFLRILPDGSKRTIEAEDLSRYGIRS